MKKTSLRRRSKNPRSRLIKKLDASLSVLIRRRDTGKPCIDLCGRRGVMQAGHFRRREFMMTRFDYRNVNAQTAYCNCWDNDTYRHAKGIDLRWGPGTAKELDRLSKVYCQWSLPQLEMLIGATESGYSDYVRQYDLLR